MSLVVSPIADEEPRRAESEMGRELPVPNGSRRRQPSKLKTVLASFLVGQRLALAVPASARKAC